MTYPMMGTGANDFSRSGGDYTHTFLHYFVLLSGQEWSAEKLGKTRVGMAEMALSYIASVRRSPEIKKSENPHLLPHGGTKWGNKFTVVQFRLDRNSRKRRFVPRTRSQNR